MKCFKELDKLHERLSNVIGSQWGIGWTYAISFNEDYKAVKITVTQPSPIKSCVEVIGDSVADALSYAADLLQASIDRNKEQAVPKHEVWQPSQMDFAEMDGFFAANMTLYQQRFAPQLSQTGYIPYSKLTSEQRHLLCCKWVAYKKAINNE